MRIIDHVIAGTGGGAATRTGDVFDSNSGQVQARVNLGPPADLDRAVAAAENAQPVWTATNPQRRARVMFRFKELFEQDMDELARLLSSEHGKVVVDLSGAARGSAGERCMALSVVVPLGKKTADALRQADPHYRLPARRRVHRFAPTRRRGRRRLAHPGCLRHPDHGVSRHDQGHIRRDGNLNGKREDAG